MKAIFLIEKKVIVKKQFIQKKKKETTPQHFCVAEDCMLLEGGVLCGFTRPSLTWTAVATNRYLTTAV